MHRIKKTFQIAYAHRLLGHKGKCANLHGHNGVIEVTLKVQKLNSADMVMDFADLSTMVKTWLDENLDHRTILNKKDPLLKILRDEGHACFETDQNPTAEILAMVIFEIMKKSGMAVEEVVFCETPTAMASYKGF